MPMGSTWEIEKGSQKWGGERSYHFEVHICAKEETICPLRRETRTGRRPVIDRSKMEWRQVGVWKTEQCAAHRSPKIRKDCHRTNRLSNDALNGAMGETVYTEANLRNRLSIAESPCYILAQKEREREREGERGSAFRREKWQPFQNEQTVCASRDKCIMRHC